MYLNLKRVFEPNLVYRARTEIKSNKEKIERVSTKTISKLRKGIKKNDKKKEVHKKTRPDTRHKSRIVDPDC